MPPELPEREGPVAVPVPPEIHAEGVVGNAEATAETLKLPAEAKKGWGDLLKDIFVSVRRPEEAKDGSGKRGAFFQMEYAALVKAQQTCLQDLQDVVAIRNAREPLDEVSRKIVLEDIAGFLKRREGYDFALENTPKAPSRIPAYLAVFAEELVEEGAESLTGFGEQWSLKWMRDLDRATQREILRAGLRVQSRLAAAGVKQVPGLRRVLGSEFMKDIFKGLRPDSYVTVVLFAYYLHMSDDKTAAALQFASFMVMSGLSNALLGLAERQIAKRLGAGHILARVPGHPVIKIAAAILLIYGESELGIVDKGIKTLEGWVEPVKWDATGTIVETFSGSALFGQLNEIGYMTGMLDVHPELDQMSYLSQRILIMDYDEGNFWKNLTHGTRDWDELVDQAMKRDQNPLRKELWKLQSIDKGPGGRSGWIARQALDFYTRVDTLRHLEQALGEHLKSDGVLQNANSFCLSGLVVEGGSLEGDSPVRVVLREPPYDKVTAHVEGVRKKNPNDERVMLYDQCVSMAREIANRRCVYVYLKVYSSDWARPRTVKTDDDQTLKLVPDIVERGIVSQLALKSQRKEKLLYAGQMARKDYGKYLGNLVLVKDELETPVNDIQKLASLGMVEKVNSPVPLVYIEATRNAAESAASCLPPDHDINVLFSDLRYYVESRKPISFSQIVRLRDHFTDAVRRQHEERTPYVPASREFRASLGLPESTQVFSSEEILDPVVSSKEKREEFRRQAGADPTHLLLRHAFAEQVAGDARGRSSDVALVQFVIAEATYGLAIMALTSFNCTGPDPDRWTVRIRRHHCARRSGPPRAYENYADRGHEDLISFRQWLCEHPRPAQQLHTTFEEIRMRRQSEYKAEQEPRARDLRKAWESTDTFVRISTLGEYRRRYGDSWVILQKLPTKRSFDHQKYRPHPHDDETYDVRELSEEGEQPYWVRHISFYSDADKGLTREVKNAMRDVVTTPIEGKDEESLAGVMNLASADVRMKHYYIPSNFRAAFGTECKYYYTELFDALLPLYREAKDKKYFLDRLFLGLYWRMSQGIDEGTASTLAAWFKNHMHYFDGRMTQKDKERCESGEWMLPVFADGEGTYTYNVDNTRGKTPLYYFYSVGAGWRWSPDKECWLPLTTTVVPKGRYKGKSPTQPNQEFLRKLDGATH